MAVSFLAQSLMTLQDFTTHETSALIERILTRRANALGEHLRLVRQAMEAAERAAQSPPAIEEDVAELVNRLNQAFSATARRIQDEARKAAEQANRELESQRIANDALMTSVSGLEAEVDRQRAELREAIDRATEAERDLNETRDALSEQIGARAAAETTSRFEAEARASIEEDLLAARSENVASISRIGELESLLDSERTETAILKADLESAHHALQQAEAARDLAEDALARQAGLEGALQTELQEARLALDESLAEIAQLGAQLEAIAGDRGRLSIALSAAQGELEMAQAQHKAVSAQLKASTARAHMFERSQTETIGHLKARLDDAQRGGGGDQQQEPTAQSHAGVAGLELAGGHTDPDLLSAVEASVRSVEELTQAASLADLLNSLARELSSRFCRVALFRVEGNRLQGAHQAGFDYTTDVRKIAIPLAVDALLTRVARSGEIERLSGAELADDSKGAPFRGSPSLALALPVVLRGETVAVVYVDNWNHAASAPGRGSDESSVLFARLVIRQAGILFLGLAHELRVLTELRDYASMLVLGAEQMYAADAESKMSAEMLRSRLEDNLACARQLFAQRAALEGPAAAGLLDEQLEATIAGDPSAPFARELAAIAVRAREAETRRSAEAC